MNFLIFDSDPMLRLYSRFTQFEMSLKAAFMQQIQWAIAACSQAQMETVIVVHHLAMLLFSLALPSWEKSMAEWRGPLFHL